MLTWMENDMSKKKKKNDGGVDALCTSSDWLGSTPEYCGDGAAATAGSQPLPHPLTSTAASAPISAAREGGGGAELTTLLLVLLSNVVKVVRRHTATTSPPEALLLVLLPEAEGGDGFCRWTKQLRGIVARAFTVIIVVRCVRVRATSSRRFVVAPTNFRLSSGRKR